MLRYTIVPHGVRKHFPEKYRKYSKYDTIVLCRHCHSIGDKFLLGRLNGYFAHYGLKNTPHVNPEAKKTRIAAHTLLNKNINLNKEKEELHRLQILSYYKVDQITEEILKEAYHLEYQLKTDPIEKRLVDCLLKDGVDFDLFVVDWRKEFIAHMKPKYMPRNWFCDFIYEEEKK